MEPGQVDIKRGYFKGVSLSPFLFAIILPTLMLVLKEMKVGYKQKNMTSIDHLSFINDLNLYGTNRLLQYSLRTSKWHLDWINVQCC